MSEIGTAYVKIEPTAKGISGSISNIIDDECASAGKSGGAKLASGIGTVMKAGTVAIGAGVAAIGKFASDAVSSYANYEQLVGGVEKLYGSAAGKLEEFANNAYKTSGMSANQYMETATSFSAALVSSLDGDVSKAADITDVAMKAMSDNVNVFGSDMASVEYAFKGFAKQNYTMLDNLKLGYGGTKTEMERLLADAEELTGVKYDMSNFSDVILAIQAIQENMGIAGTTTKEAMHTIEGSAASVNAAWQNVITAIGSGEGLDEAINNLVEGIFGGEGGGGLLENILPRIQTVMEGIGTFVETAAPFITEKLPVLIESVLPSLLQSATTLIGALGEGLLAALPALIPVAMDIIVQLVQMLIQGAPQLIEVGIQAIVELANGLAQALPTLIPMAIEAILAIVDALIENIDLLIDAAIAIIMGLAEGLIEALPQLIERIPEIITKIVSALIENAPKLLEAAVELIVTLGRGLIEAIPQLIANIPEIISALKNGFIEYVGEMMSVGADIVNGIWEGISGAWGDLVAKAKEKLSSLADLGKKALKIGSPSKVFRDEVGRWIPEGIAVGIEANADSMTTAVDDMVAQSVAKPQMNMLAETADSINPAIASGTVTSVNTEQNGLLAQYLPALLTAVQNSGVTLEGDAKQIFNVVRKENNLYRKSNGGASALA